MFDATVESKIDALANIRNMWVTTKSLETKSAQERLIEFTDWGGPERATVVSQVNMLGVKLANAGVISEQAYRAIGKFLGTYWFEKGKASMIDFLNFCLGTDLKIDKLWTMDYKHFYKEGSSFIGATIYDDVPGPWFPTTHVAITMPPDFVVDVLTVARFFSEIANYNLVLRIVAGEYEMPIVTPGDDRAYIVAAGLEINNILKIQTAAYDFRTLDLSLEAVTTMLDRLWTFITTATET